jgi:hypothetical protein
MFSHKPSGGLRARREACAVIDDPDPLKLMHRLAEILRARILAIACEDANDLDRPHFDPAFKLTRGRLPDSGLDVCSQPAISTLRERSEACARSSGLWV